MDRIGGQSIGVFVIALPIAVTENIAMQQFLAANDVTVEVLGYVA
jgi:hypothetical protein